MKRLIIAIFTASACGLFAGEDLWRRPGVEYRGMSEGLVAPKRKIVVRKPRPRVSEYTRAYAQQERVPYYGRFKEQDLAAYAGMEPNAPAPKQWLEEPEVMGARRRPSHEQLIYVPEKNVTPDIVEAHEQWKSSKVEDYLPKRSWGLQGWKDYYYSPTGYDLDKYALKRRIGEAADKYVFPPFRWIKAQQFSEDFMTPDQYIKYLNEIPEEAIDEYYESLPERRRIWLKNYFNNKRKNYRWYNAPGRWYDQAVRKYQNSKQKNKNGYRNAYYDYD